MKKIIFIVLLFAVSALSLPAEARIYIRIDEIAERKFPIAIPPLTNYGEKRDRKDWAHQIPEIIENDLRLSGLFEFIPADLFPQKDTDFLPHKINFAGWKLVGIQGLIKGGIQYAGGKVQAKLYLYDPLIGQKLVGHEYTASANEYRTIAHHFADQVIEALTGFKGIFRTKIAFVSRASKHKEIYMTGIDGHGLAKLTNDRNINISPAWSPGGGKIAYTSYTDDGDAEIKYYDLGARKSRQVTRNQGINLSPTWTPNGRYITAMMANSDANIFNISLRGKRGKRLTSGWGIDIAPSWAPGGGSFVFASERAGGLHLFRSGGGGTQRLTFVGYQNDNPDWSPDGEKIVFQGRDQGVWDLFIMNPDGSLLQRLTAGTGNNQEPTWAPNSQYIAFSSSRTGAYQIHMMTNQGENQVRVSKASGTQPSWGPFVD